MRGLRVALFERRDFGSGTTAASTRIVHGGLRYLERLDLRLVRMDLRERETLLRIAPHLVEPLEFLIPFMSGGPVSALKLRLGLALYDALSPDTSLPRHRVLSASAAKSADGCLQRDDVRGAAAYFDARVDLPERLALGTRSTQRCIGDHPQLLRSDTAYDFRRRFSTCECATPSTETKPG